MRKEIGKLLNFPRTDIGNIKLFYLVSAGTSFWLIEAVWFLYWGRFAPYSQISIIFALTAMLWIVLEIPTGAIADMFGRKFATALGVFFFVIEGSTMLFAGNIWHLTIAAVAGNIGRAFVSGSMEAMVYDTLKEKGIENEYERIVSARTRVIYISYAIATVLGGYLYAVNIKLPYILSTLIYLFVFLLSLGFKEVIVANRPRIGLGSYLNQNLEGLRQLLGKRMRFYILPIVAVLSVYFLYDWGLSKPAIAVSFGYDSIMQGIVYAGVSVVNVWVIGKFTWLREKLGDFLGIVVLNLAMGVGFALAVINWGMGGIFIFLLIESAGSLTDPWISTIVNSRINSQDRATTLSSLEFLSKIPFLFLILLTGANIEDGTIGKVHFVFGVTLIVLATVYYVLFRKSHKITTGVID